MRLTIDEYSKNFKMSKEMIRTKLRSKKLNYIVENNITYIIVTKKPVDTNFTEEENTTTDHNKEKEISKAITKPKTTVATVLALYQKENQQLKEKIAYLDGKVDKLIDDKEQMLRDEMQRIEHVYSQKDEQLKTILELINTKMMIENENSQIHEIETIEAHEEIEKEKTENDEQQSFIELKVYLKTLDIKAYQKKIIRKRFLSSYNSDVRIIQQNGKLHLDFSKHDYSDLLAF